MEFLLHVKFTAGLVAFIGGLLAELSTTDAVSQGGLWIGIAGVITACGAVAREYLGDREKNRVYQSGESQKQRDYDLAKLRLTLRNDQNRRVALSMYRYAVEKRNWDIDVRNALLAIPGCPNFPPPPPVPALPEGYATAMDAEAIKGDA